MGGGDLLFDSEEYCFLDLVARNKLDVVVIHLDISIKFIQLQQVWRATIAIYLKNFVQLIYFEKDTEECQTMEINLKKAILRKIFEACSVIEIYFEKAIWKVLYNWNIFLDRYLKSVVQLK